MGVSTSPAQLAGKLFVAGAAVGAAGSVGVQKGALAFKVAAQAAAPSWLSGVGKNGRALGVRYNGGTYADGAKYLVFATGPWQLIERDTKPHRIPKLMSGSRSRAARPQFGPAFGGVGRKELALANGSFRAAVWHPGTKGKHPWEKTEAVMVPLIPKIIDAGVIGALKAIF